MFWKHCASTEVIRALDTERTRQAPLKGMGVVGENGPLPVRVKRTCDSRGFEEEVWLASEVKTTGNRQVTDPVDLSRNSHLLTAYREAGLLSLYPSHINKYPRSRANISGKTPVVLLSQGRCLCAVLSRVWEIRSN